jgi:mono/diheme cytochrome c family protein
MLLAKLAHVYGIGSAQLSAIGDKLVKSVRCLVSFLVISVTVSDVCAQAFGDPQKGLAAAQQVCSDCHAIGSGQVHSPNLRAPAFRELARAPGMTTAALTVALTTAHAGMPMFALTSNQRQDIIAYILSLR